MPAKRGVAGLLKNQTYLMEKLYKDLRFIGIFDVNFQNTTFKLYNPGFTTIENEIFWKGIEGGWEKISLNIWSEISKDAKVVLDIGANSGIYSLVARAVNQESEIYAFEPVKRTAEIFQKNISINDFKHVHLYKKAVSNKSGESIFFDINTESQYSASLSEKMLTNNPDRITYKVQVVAIDEMKEFENKKVDLIKLDVEMHEPEAVEGMIKVLKRDHPILLIEILTDEIAEKIQRQLSGLDYLYFNIDEINSPKRVEKLEKSAYYNFLICDKETAVKLKLNCEL